jgi:hypothetical protein
LFVFQVHHPGGGQDDVAVLMGKREKKATAWVAFYMAG